MLIPVSELQRQGLTTLATAAQAAAERRDLYLSAILEGAGVTKYLRWSLTPEGLDVVTEEQG